MEGRQCRRRRMWRKEGLARGEMDVRRKVDTGRSIKQEAI